MHDLLPPRLILASGWLDPTVVLLYLAASFWLGLRGARMLRSQQQNEEDYYLAGKNVPGWINGVSYAVTLVNADVAPVYCGMAAGVGLPIAWFYISRFGLALMLAAMLFAFHWHRLGIRTGPEFFTLRFGGEPSKWVRAYTSAYSVAIGSIPWIGAGLLGVHMIFAPLMGIESKTVSLLLVLPVVVVYVWTSGFAGVLVTDVMQTAVILAANVCVMVSVMKEFHGPAGLADAVVQALPADAEEILSLTPVPGHHAMGPLAVAAWLVVSTIGVGGSVAMEGQRLFSCRTPRSAASVGVWCEAALFAMLALLTLPTLGVLARHPELYHAEPKIRETAYSLLLHDFLPPGLLGLALAALLAAVMSTVAGLVNFSSQTLLNDVVRQLAPNITDRRAVLTGRLLSIIVLALAVAVMSASDSLIGIAVVVVGLFGSALTFGWGQWWWWRANFSSWCAATIGGPVIYFSLMNALPYWPWWNAQAAISPSWEQTMTMVHAALTMAATTLLWIAVALATPPESLETLKTFYLRARPPGLWGPVRRALADDLQLECGPPRGEILRGFATALVGSLWVALLCLALGAAVVGRYRTAVQLALSGAVTAVGFWMLFRRHLDRLEGERGESPAEKS
jgi:Na+/proline symporter